MGQFSSKFRPSKKVAVGVAVAASLAGAIALGAVLTPGGDIHGCFDRNGALRVIDTATSTCRPGETAITWNQRGQQGLQGVQGPSGLTGATGSTGPAGKDGAPGRDGRDGVQGPQGLTGPQGLQGPAGPQGPAGGTTGGGTTGGGTTGGSQDLFLAIPDVEGESVDATHKGDIDIMSFNWSVAQTGLVSSGTGTGAGKAQFTSLTVTKRVDKSSPVLFLDAASGKHLNTATVFVRKAGAVPLEYLKITLKDVLVSSIDTAGESDRPLEKLSLSFGQISIDYTPQNADGSAGATISGGWDILKNIGI